MQQRRTPSSRVKTSEGNFDTIGQASIKKARLPLISKRRVVCRRAYASIACALRSSRLPNRAPYCSTGTGVADRLHHCESDMPTQGPPASFANTPAEASASNLIAVPHRQSYADSGPPFVFIATCGARTYLDKSGLSCASITNCECPPMPNGRRWTYKCERVNLLQIATSTTAL